MIKRFDCDSRIIRYFEDEKSEFEYEYQRINELWELNQCVCNINSGGKGGTTNWWTDEKRQWYSTHNVMKSLKQRERMSTNNPMKNKEVALKVNQKNSKPIIINNKEYKSITDVCEKYNTSHDVVQNWCKKGINSFGETCRYKDKEQINFNGKRYNKGSCKPITYMGKTYESPLDLSEELKISKYITYRWCKKGFDDEGNPCRYIGDNRKLIYKKYINGESKMKPIIVNGVYYKSKVEAEKILNIKVGGLSPYIKGQRKNKKYICEYVNQQPNHTNSDKSSVEGSTTNE